MRFISESGNYTLDTTDEGYCDVCHRKVSVRVCRADWDYLCLVCLHVNEALQEKRLRESYAR